MDSDSDNQAGNGESRESDNELAVSNDNEGIREISFVPAKGAGKADDQVEPTKELTPWEKYKEKRKQKKREKKEAAREKRKQISKLRKKGSIQPDGMVKNIDDFFISSDNNTDEDKAAFGRQSKEETALLVAGEEDDEDTRDFDMRGLERLEKYKGKKLRGARKRKEEKIAETVTGTEFKIDVADDRFKAVLDGSDSRFGIDRTDPSYKDTAGMREILKEQAERRKKKRRNTREKTLVPDVCADSSKSSSGAATLSALVSSIKSKVK